MLHSDFMRQSAPMTISFEGIEEKLKRSHQSILSLEDEVSRFFKECKYPFLPDLGDERLLEAIGYHRKLKIPSRFSVLAGEIVHHLRSSLDHLVWEFSDQSYRHSPNHRFIGFPILKERPSSEQKPTKYDRKIKGVRNVAVLNLIADLQPYERVDPLDDLLLILHDMDIADKHRELFLISSTGSMDGLPPDLAQEFSSYLGGALGPLPAELKRKFNQYGKITPRVSFPDFGRQAIQPVVPGLTRLANKIKDVVAQFEAHA
jgi:hypothetical protein